MTLFPSIVFSTKKRPKRRHSVFSHHAVDKSDVLTKPFLPLETRINSPADLIDLVGHPRLAIELPPPNQQQDVYDRNRNNFDKVSPITPIPNQPTLDKTLLDVPPSPPSKAAPFYSTTRIHYSETLYNTERGNVRHAPPPILHRQRSSPLPLGSRPQKEYDEDDDDERDLPLPGQDDLMQLRKQYDQEQATWRQRLHGYRVREQELMDLLESTRAKLDQLETNAASQFRSPPPSDKIQYHHHHHHHHYYYIQPKRPTRKNSNKHMESNNNNEIDLGPLDKQRVMTKSLSTYAGLPMVPPPDFWYSPYS